MRKRLLWLIIGLVVELAPVFGAGVHQRRQEHCGGKAQGRSLAIAGDHQVYG